jgi:multidrug resistance efflux pump
MLDTGPKLRRAAPAREQEPLPPAPPPIRDVIKPRSRVVPLLVTLATVALAVALSWAMWNAYMGTPWTRDGTVRVYVVTMAPEVAGRIVELPVTDNRFVHKDDVLMVIDPTNYRIAVDLAEAAVAQAQANVQNFEAQVAVQQAQVSVSQAQVERAQAALVFAQQQEARYQDLAQKGWSLVQTEQQVTSQLHQDEAALKNAQAALALAQRQIVSLNAQRAGAEAQPGQSKAQLNQARVNLERTQIRSPVNGWVTNLLAQLGDYANVGQNEISVVDADSFWIDAYFTETNLGSIREGDPANIKLMGYSEIVRGRVGSISRGINVQNAQGGPQGLQTVNPIFTWVRLAQRIPVRINIDHVPDGVTLAAGLTATVEIEPRARPSQSPAPAAPAAPK